MTELQKAGDFKLLAETLEGDLYSDELHRYMMATDGSIYQKQPACVVYPRTRGDVTKVVNFAREQGLTVHPRGAGSGLCGSAIGEGILLDFTRYMNRLLKLDHKQRWFECEPGYRFGELEAELKESGLFFPPDPSSGEYATFGGMYGTNASGAHSVKYGNVSDYILDAEVCLSDGSTIVLSDVENTPLDQLPPDLKSLSELYLENTGEIEQAYPEIKCNVAGYNLRGLVQNNSLRLHHLLAGAEGTLGVVTRLRFCLLLKPTHDSLVVAFFDDILKSARAAQLAVAREPSGIEIMDKSLLNLAKENDPGLRDKIPDDVDNLLLIEFDAFDPDQAKQEAEAIKTILEKEGLTHQAHLAASDEEKARFWAVRKAAVPILYKLKGEKKILALIEDAAIPIDGLVGYFEGIYKILNNHNLRFVVYGHIAKGLMHTRPLLNLKEKDDIALLKVLADEVYDLVTGLGGTVSGEHGDGRIRSFYIQKRYPGIYSLFEKVKQLMDRPGLFNPEIITNTDPDLISTNLRFGTAYQANEIEDLRLNWDEGFVHQVETCHGCSKCTTITTATRMCPIYKFTREESASPKAKANVLRALISGAIGEASLFQKTFREVIDHCVVCGSCYRECPSNVNIPKLALEARSQYVARYGTDLYSKIVTQIETAARLTGPLSGILAPVMNWRLTRSVMEKTLGLASERKPVAFSSSPLVKRIGRTEENRSRSLLYFAGCYASYIRPEIGVAAIRVLEKQGYRVLVPEQHCCGLPLLSKGMARGAREKIIKNLSRWADMLDAVEHVVVTCSSCGLSLGQEWSYLRNCDATEKIRNKLVHISDLVLRSETRLDYREIPLNIGYHMPCHLKVQPAADSSLNLLKCLPGVKVGDIGSHCCGIAGSWGLSKDHYGLSKTIGEDMIRRLESSDAEIGVTDCPTCRMQMEHFSDKPILHPIEVVAERMDIDS